VRARYVHIREVSAVGFVEIIVGFEERSTSGCDYGLKQCMRRNSGRLQINLIRQGADEAYLRPRSVTLQILTRGWRAHTCHTKGRFLRFTTAKRIAAIRHMPPGVSKPVYRDRAATKISLREGSEAIVATDTPARARPTICAMILLKKVKYTAVMTECTNKQDRPDVKE